MDWDVLLFNNVGEVLSITIKPELREIIWDNGRKTITTPLEPCFTMKPLYLFVVMYDEGSKV
jgi:hypothetical protein